ncbi:hypothetical protein BST61_g5376 [Cercospora zeina]
MYFTLLILDAVSLRRGPGISEDGMNHKEPSSRQPAILITGQKYKHENCYNYPEGPNHYSNDLYHCYYNGANKRVYFHDHRHGLTNNYNYLDNYIDNYVNLYCCAFDNDYVDGNQFPDYDCDCHNSRYNNHYYDQHSDHDHRHSLCRLRYRQRRRQSKRSKILWYPK